MAFLLVLTQCPDQPVADQIARAVVEARLAACVTCLAPARATYRWQDAIETATEIPLLIKSTEAAYPALEAMIRHHHPYEVPEIIALPLNHGLPDYLNWLAAETCPS
jgi:periplasmic divalent cation tolerance protein